MNQSPLFHESIEDALKAVVQACGGAKVVGCKLWPDKTPEAAHRLLLASLNEDRQERLSPGQVLVLLKMGRERGIHDAMNYIASDTGYQAQPVEPEDERARLQREYIQAVKVLTQIADRMERVGAPAQSLRAV